jgi:hypothetical protein
MTSILFRYGRRVALIAALASPLYAQGSQAAVNVSRWSPYLGCWATSSAGAIGPMICVVPTDSAEVVEMVTVIGDSIAARNRVDASGARTIRTRDGCTGWDQATWSADDRRVFTKSEFTCAGSGTQTSTGIFAMSHEDAFARIDAVTTKSGATRVRLVNFILVEDTALAPAEIRSRLPKADALPQRALRIDAAAELSTADIADASKIVDGVVAEAWIGDRGQRFTIKAADLRALKQSGVPTRVIDMVVAVSNPQTFMLASGKPSTRPADVLAQRPDLMSTNEALALLNARRTRAMLYGGWFDDVYSWNAYGSPYGLSYSSLYGNFYNYGFNPYGNGYNNGYNNGWFGGNGYGQGPFVIIPRDPEANRPSNTGRAVNGLGYTQDPGAGSSGTAVPRPSVGSDGYSQGGGGPASVGSSGSGSSGSGSSGSAGSGASSGSGGRTAKERP